MTSKVIVKECEYDHDLYSALLTFQEDFSSYIEKENKNRNFIYIFQTNIDKIILKDVMSKDDNWINSNKHYIKEQSNKEFKNVCVRVYRSIADISSKKGYNANIVRIMALTIYYIVRLKPIRCCRIKTITNSFEYDYIDYNAMFALSFAEIMIEQEYEISLNLSNSNKEHVRTLEHTLKYNTINKALIIEILDKIVFYTLEQKRHQKYLENFNNEYY